jgi:hypothetical protein
LGSTIGLFGDQGDTSQLMAVATSMGLQAIAMRADRTLASDPADGPGCYLSLVPSHELHPFGDPPVRYTDARDPLLFFMRPYYKAPYLVAGQINWNNDDPSLAAITRPYFQRLARWVRANWKKPENCAFYAGPGASERIAEGAELVNVLPGTAEFNVIVVPRSS